VCVRCVVGGGGVRVCVCVMGVNFSNFFLFQGKLFYEYMW
jgi:hypothetical protein